MSDYQDIYALNIKDIFPEENSNSLLGCINSCIFSSVLQVSDNILVVQLRLPAVLIKFCAFTLHTSTTCKSFVKNYDLPRDFSGSRIWSNVTRFCHDSLA